MCGIRAVAMPGRSAGVLHRLEQPAEPLRRRGPDHQSDALVGGRGYAHAADDGYAAVALSAAVLHMRGESLTPQPHRDAHGNALLFNGEVFGALGLGDADSDTDSVLSALASATEPHRDVPASCAAAAILEFLGRLEGPHALVFWHSASATLWYARDGMGRRSLLRCWPAAHRGGLVLCSVAHAATRVVASSDAWEELPTDGIGSARLLADGSIEHGWHGRRLPSPAAGPPMCAEWESEAWLARERAAAASALLGALSDAVRRRVARPPYDVHPVAVAFSGGIDCMVLARLADAHVPAAEPIELINVAVGGDSAPVAPDRLTARAGVDELRSISPARDWRLVEVDVSLDELIERRAELLQLLQPCSTVMDLTIGAALWFGARGLGRLAPVSAARRPHADESRLCRYARAAEAEAALPSPPPRLCDEPPLPPPPPPPPNHVRASLEVSRDRVRLRIHLLRVAAAAPRRGAEYRSSARILLLGMGADEQMAGYGRHRTVFKHGGWRELREELMRERGRLWLRNLGRDDRVVSDWAREARYPYLDERVVELLSRLALPVVCDLVQELGAGDKLVLRNVARELGLRRSSYLQKRAIQFGTRIANRRVHGTAKVSGDMDIAELVHRELGSSAAGAPPARVTREELCKKTAKKERRASRVCA